MARLGASDALHQGEVEATNWMSALRAARQGMGERPSLPPGASCSVDANGVATVLDAASRRKFVLSPQALDEAAAPASEVAATAVAPPAQAAPAAPAVESAAAQQQPPPVSKPKRFETVAMIPERAAAPAAVPVTQPAPQQAQAPVPAPIAAPTEAGAADHVKAMEPSAPQTQAPAHEPAAASPQAPARPKKRFETMTFADGAAAARAANLGPEARSSGAAAAPQASPQPAATRSSRPPLNLELLLERDEEPTPANPLCYRERAFLLPKGVTVPEAEAALRFKLADLQQALIGRPRGKLVNLAVFDHRWRTAPERPPLIVLQWRDWRDEVEVDYPATMRVSSVPPGPAPHDDVLADVFEALEGLSGLHTAAEGMDFTVQLLERTIPAEATSACLYDINTDELRFVAVTGTAAAEMQGQAVPRAAGLFAVAVRDEHHASVFDDVAREAAFTPAIDSRPGLNARDLLLRPIVHEHQLLGVLQLINRRGGVAFNPQDASVISYVAERLADFLHAARLRHRGPS